MQSTPARLLLAALLPFLSASAPPPASFQNPLLVGIPPNPADKYTCDPSNPIAPLKREVAQIPGYLRDNLADTPIKNDFEKECTKVVTQHSAAVYICNTGGIAASEACGAVTGSDVASAIDEMVNDGKCLGLGSGPRVGGRAWVSGPNMGKGSWGCAQQNAAYIELVNSEN